MSRSGGLQTADGELQLAGLLFCTRYPSPHSRGMTPLRGRKTNVRMIASFKGPAHLLPRTMNEQIEELKQRWISAQPLKSEDEERLWQKYRLEWNYNSNHIEGNTLTYGETELLFLQGQTIGSHELREYEEMKAHDVAIFHVRDLAKSDKMLTEADIRGLNKIILKEPFWKPAQTAEGAPTRKQIIPGEYKCSPNNVRTKTGELFSFASPLETPGKMQELIAWLNGELKTDKPDIIAISAELHHRFLLIHPFDDGNGRVARLLSNYLFLKNGYPPIIVKSADKANYVAALRLADSGDVKGLITYFESQLDWSLNVALQAARGASIEELSDVEKELAIFIQDQDTERSPVVARSVAVLLNTFESGLKDLISKTESKLNQLQPLFSENATTFSPWPGEWRTLMPERFSTQPNHSDYTWNFAMQGYKGRATTPFTVNFSFSVHFEQFSYSFRTSGVTEIKKLYSEPILSDEADAFSTALLKYAFNQIRNQAGVNQ